MTLPGDTRDRLLRELCPVLGVDYWALDEVVKCDAERALVESLDLQVNGDTVEHTPTELRKDLESARDAQAGLEAEISSLEEELDEHRSFRREVLPMFGVDPTTTVQDDDGETVLERPVEDLIDDMSIARDHLTEERDGWRDAYWDLRCETYAALGLDATRDDAATLQVATTSECAIAAAVRDVVEVARRVALGEANLDEM